MNGLRVSHEVTTWIFHTLDNDLEIKNYFTKYLKETDEYFSVKYFQNCFCQQDFTKIIRLVLGAVSITRSMRSLDISVFKGQLHHYTSSKVAANTQI